MKPLSTKLGRTEPSATLAVSDKARVLKAQGRDVVALAGGDPDFITPAHIIEAAERAMRAGDTHYPASRGTPKLVDAIVAKLARENGVTATAKEIIVAPGAKWALYLALAAILDPGDEVITLDPSWVSYGPMIALNDGVPVPVDLDPIDVPAAELEPRLRELASTGFDVTREIPLRIALLLR